MEVQTCTVVRKAVSDVYFDRVTPVCFDRWACKAKRSSQYSVSDIMVSRDPASKIRILRSRTWDTPIYSEHGTSIAVRRCGNVRELEPVFDRDPSVGDHVVVVCADVVVAPDASVACSVA